MRDVIEKMLQAEAEAKRIVAQAEVDAEQIRAESRHRAQDLAEKVRLEAHDEAAAIVRQASEEAEKEKQARIARAAKVIDGEVRMDDEFRAGAVEAVVRCVRGMFAAAKPPQSR